MDIQEFKGLQVRLALRDSLDLRVFEKLIYLNLTQFLGQRGPPGEPGISIPGEKPPPGPPGQPGRPVISFDFEIF